MADLDDLIAFLTASPSPWHVVSAAAANLVAAGFEPIAGGMAAALPHCDHFLAGHTARSMQEVIAAVTSVGPVRGATRRGPVTPVR